MKDELLDALTDEDWDEFAQQWMSELRSETSYAVTSMNFTARPSLQWKFILKAVNYAESDDELSVIAAGPLEHLLGRHGLDFIDQVEELAEVNSKFSRLLCSVWKYTIKEEVWTRLQLIVEKVKNIEKGEKEADPKPNEYHEKLFINAVGPVIELLGRQGEDFIALVEKRAAENLRFAKLLSKIARTNMDQGVWMRLQAIAARHTPPENLK